MGPLISMASLELDRRIVGQPPVQTDEPGFLITAFAAAVAKFIAARR